MNKRQRAYFRKKLVLWRNEVCRSIRRIQAELNRDNFKIVGTPSCRSTKPANTGEYGLDWHLSRSKTLLKKVDAALTRIDNGTYGYCEQTGSPIGLRRLDARAIATLSLDDNGIRTYRHNFSLT